MSVWARGFRGAVAPALPGAALLCFPGDSQRRELPHLTEPSEQSCPEHPLVIQPLALGHIPEAQANVGRAGGLLFSRV